MRSEMMRPFTVANAATMWKTARRRQSWCRTVTTARVEPKASILDKARDPGSPAPGRQVWQTEVQLTRYLLPAAIITTCSFSA